MRRAKKKPMAEINVVPYIDVMLVLLVIFMITAPLLTPGINVDLPQAPAKVIEDQPVDPLILSIDINGLLYLNSKDNASTPLDDQAILDKVALALKTNPKRSVLVKGDKRVSYGTVISAMVLLQQAGAASVGLVSEPLVNNNPSKSI